MPTTRLTHFSALSPHGPTRTHFHSGVATAVAGAVPDFEIRTALGKTGTRSMDRVTALAVAAIGDLIVQPGAAELIDSRTAIVLGTTAGSVASTMRFTRDSLTEERPYLVDPARFPNTVMNCAAGRSAIWHKLRGPNATLAGGRASGLMALNYARRLLDTGRADTVVIGAAEELSSERTRIDPHTEGATGAPLSEGAGVFLLHRHETDPTATGLELIGPVSTRAVSEANAGAVAMRESLDALARTGIDAESVVAVAVVGPLDLGDRVTAALPAAGPVLRPEHHLGDTGAAASIFAMALLARLSRPGVALVLAYDEHTLVTAVVRIHGEFR